MAAKKSKKNIKNQKKNSNLYHASFNYVKTNFFPFLFYAFIFMVVAALSIKPQKANLEHKGHVAGVQNTKQASSQAEYQIVTTPVVADEAIFPLLSAQSVLAYDLEADSSLYEKNTDQKMLPASTTKIMTALVSIDYYSLDKVIDVDGIRVAGQKMGLVQGENISVKDLLYGLLMYSANDAAEVLAHNYLGGREGFIDEMNRKAEQLGLQNTLFSNPSGLDGNSHYTTSYDLLYLAELAMKDPVISEIVQTESYMAKSVDGAYIHPLKNLNELVGSVDGVLGVKTGWTEIARENLVTYIERNGRRIMIVLLGSQDRFGETKELINWIFENYTWQEHKVPVN